MSNVIRLLHGNFGRVALLEMDGPLVTHAHHHCHILCKVSGPDTAFQTKEIICPATSENAVLINAWEEHAYLHIKNQKQLPILLCLYLEPKWLASFSKKFIASSHSHFFPSNTYLLDTFQKQMIEKISMELWWSDLITNEHLEQMLVELCVSFLDGVESISLNEIRKVNNQFILMDPRIRKAISLMHNSPQGFQNVNEIAAKVNLSRAHFFELFRKSTGLSPIVYSNVLKMEFAFEALTKEKESLINIGDDLGFSAQSHFTRFFKQHQGVTPGHYRRQVEKVSKE